MRVATSTLYEGMQKRLLRLSAELKDINEKVASGKKINRPSDDPLALVDIMQLKTARAQLDQYSRNIQTAQSWTQSSESALSQTLEILGRAREIAVEMTSDTQSSATRSMAATEVGSLLDQAISLANTQLAGKYIFAGYVTNTAPFTKVTLGGIETAQYNGDTNNFQVQIGKDETVTAGKNGQTVFMDSNLFDTLGNLKKALEDNDPATIGQQLGNLQGAEDFLNNQIADVGARQNRLDVKQGIFDQLDLTLQERLSEKEDADLAEVMLDLKAKELTYQAALAASARIHELTLLNYMD